MPWGAAAYQSWGYSQHSLAPAAAMTAAPFTPPRPSRGTSPFSSPAAGVDRFGSSPQESVSSSRRWSPTKPPGRRQLQFTSTASVAPSIGPDEATEEKASELEVQLRAARDDLAALKERAAEVFRKQASKSSKCASSGSRLDELQVR